LTTASTICCRIMHAAVLIGYNNNYSHNHPTETQGERESTGRTTKRRYTPEKLVARSRRHALGVECFYLTT
jgi:hypothetical protein